MQLLLRLICLSLGLIVTEIYADNDDAQSQLTEPGATMEQAAGIETRVLQTASKQHEFTAQGIVLNPEPLIRLRQQFLAVQAQQLSAQARYREADFNLARTRNLHAQDIVSTRKLQEQLAQWQSDKTNLSTNGYQQQTLLASNRLEWGDILTTWFTQPGNQQAADIANHHTQLVLISLPTTRHLPSNTQTIAIDPQGHRDQAITAKLIDAAPQADPITQTERFFFEIKGQKLPYNAHIQAWIPSKQQTDNGVIIPDTAVLRHLGQAFVYLKTTNGTFIRRDLLNAETTQNGYFVSTGFSPGEEIVTRGAQTLLSEELKNQIPSEDND